MAVTRTVLARKGLVQSAHGATAQFETDLDANLALLDANVVFLADLPADAGFAPTAGAGLTLDVASGIGFLDGALTSYAGGSLALTASSTNYVYLDPGSGLQPAFNTTGFSRGQIPIAVVVTDASAITSITDKRSQFNQTFGNVAANKFLAGPTSGAAAYPTPRSIDPSDLPVVVGDSGAGGTAGAVPAPAAGDAAAGKYLKADGAFSRPPLPIASQDATAQAADIASTALYTVPAGAGGLYRVSAYIAVTQAATSSSTLPKITIAWTDADNSAAQSLDITATDAGNLLTTLTQALAVVNAKAATDISFSTSGYASSGATAMQFAVHLRVEPL